MVLMQYLHGAPINLDAIEGFQSLGRGVRFEKGNSNDARHASIGSIGELDTLDCSNCVVKVFLNNGNAHIVSRTASGRVQGSVHEEQRRSKPRP